MRWNTRGLSSNFHGITAVAELKPVQVSAERQALPDFHGITAVAELKRQLRGRRLPEPQHFHGITAVAELKLIPVWRSV